MGRYSPGGDSPCGCADMVGNVWEWTASELEPGSEIRALRGGSFRHFREDAPCAVRYGGYPLSDWLDLGCRPVISPISTPSAL